MAARIASAVQRAGPQQGAGLGRHGAFGPDDNVRDAGGGAARSAPDSGRRSIGSSPRRTWPPASRRPERRAPPARGGRARSVLPSRQAPKPYSAASVSTARPPARTASGGVPARPTLRAAADGDGHEGQAVGADQARPPARAPSPPARSRPAGSRESRSAHCPRSHSAIDRHPGEAQEPPRAASRLARGRASGPRPRTGPFRRAAGSPRRAPSSPGPGVHHEGFGHPPAADQEVGEGRQPAAPERGAQRTGLGRRVRQQHHQAVAEQAGQKAERREGQGRGGAGRQRRDPRPPSDQAANLPPRSPWAAAEGRPGPGGCARA